MANSSRQYGHLGDQPKLRLANFSGQNFLVSMKKVLRTSSYHCFK